MTDHNDVSPLSLVMSDDELVVRCEKLNLEFVDMRIVDALVPVLESINNEIVLDIVVSGLSVETVTRIGELLGESTGPFDAPVKEDFWKKPNELEFDSDVSMRNHLVVKPTVLILYMALTDGSAIDFDFFFLHFDPHGYVVIMDMKGTEKAWENEMEKRKFKIAGGPLGYIALNDGDAYVTYFSRHS